MLAAAIQAEILRLTYAERWGYSQIARHLGIHRESVRKVALRRSVALTPAPPGPRTTVVTPFRSGIQALLTEDPARSAVTICQVLRAEGYRGGISALRGAVRRLRPSAAPAAMATLSFGRGEAAQQASFSLLDNTAPYFEMTSPLDGFRIAAGQGFQVRGKARDKQSGLAKLEWSFDGGAPIAAATWTPPVVSTGDNDKIDWVIDVPPSHPSLTPGQHDLTVYFTDGSGNRTGITPGAVLNFEVLKVYKPKDIHDLLSPRRVSPTVAPVCH